MIGGQGAGDGAVDGLPRSSSSGNVQTGQLIQIDDDVVDSVVAVGTETSINSREISPPTDAGEEVFKRPTLPTAPDSSSHSQKVGWFVCLFVEGLEVSMSYLCSPAFTREEKESARDA